MVEVDDNQTPLAPEPSAPRGLCHPHALHLCHFHLLVCHAFKRFVSKTPHLIEDTAIAPHITGSGVLAINECLRSCPLDEQNLASMRNIVAKVTELQY